MRRTIITETLGKIDQEVLLKGWVRIVRSHGKLIFLDLRDGSGTVQVVVNQQVSDEAYKTALELHPEFVIEVIGLVKKRSQKTENKKLTTGSVEIEAKKIKILAKAETLPFDMGGKDLNLELPTLLDHRGLTLRHPKIAAIFKVQETVIDSFRKACKEKGFTEFQSPVIIPQGAEGGSEVFEIKYRNN